MRAIHVEDGLTVTFPNRSDEFDEGVEVGIVLTLMAAGRDFTLWVSEGALPQVRDLAGRMRFQIVTGAKDRGTQQVIFRLGPPPSPLRLVVTRSPQLFEA